MTDTAKLLKALGHEFSDTELLARALTHRSRGSRNNERLEFLGDSFIGFVVADLLYESFADAPEGVLSRLRASLVNRDALASMARELRLGDYLQLGPGELKSGGFERSSILCDAYEALIGAVYLDAGEATARAVIEGPFRDRIKDLDPSHVVKDPKTLLQETLLGSGRPVPRYEVTVIEGPPHDRRFTVECHVDSIESSFEGRGKSRRQAEQAAASLAHQQLVERADA